MDIEKKAETDGKADVQEEQEEPQVAKAKPVAKKVVAAKVEKPKPVVVKKSIM